MSGPRKSRPWLRRAVIALAVGLVEPAVELAWKCRSGFEASEACVWGRAYLPLSRAAALLLIAPLVFAALTIAAHIVGGRFGGRPPEAGT